MLDIATLYKTYTVLTKRSKRLKAHIEQIDETLKRCDRLQRDYLLDYRKSLLDRLEGLYIAIDIVFKAIKQGKYY